MYIHVLKLICMFNRNTFLAHPRSLDLSGLCQNVSGRGSQLL